MAHFLFINPSTRELKGATSVALTMPPLGLGYLAAVVLAKGHTVQIIDANLYAISPDKTFQHVSQKPDIIGITANILSVKMAVMYGCSLKTRYPQAKLLFGGPHPSVMGKTFLEKHPEVDAVIVGEGEATIAVTADRCGQEDIFEGVAGMIYRRGDSVYDNGPRPLIEDIDTIPMPAYHFLPKLSLYQSRSRAHPVGYLLTSRGCPARCTFCYHNFGTKWRARSPEKVIEEISFLRDTYGIRQLDILDDNFSFDPGRTRKILEMIIARKWGLKINLQIGVRVNSLDEDMLVLMKKAGVFKFGFGVESGDERMVEKVKKGLDLEKAVHLVRMARRQGIMTHAYFMIGLPGDTPKTMQMTIDFAKKLDPHYASFSICMPVPGTEMFEDIKENGILLAEVANGIEEGLFASKALFQYGDTRPDDVLFYFKKAWRGFYLRPQKILDVMLTIGSWGELAWLQRVIIDIFRVNKE